MPSPPGPTLGAPSSLQALGLPEAALDRAADLAVAAPYPNPRKLERAALHRQWRQRLEQARYEVERAQRQYDAAEPENRLVARSLEQRWETALAEELRLKTEHQQFLAEQPLPLTPRERAAIERLDTIPGIDRRAAENIVADALRQNALSLAGVDGPSHGSVAFSGLTATYTSSGSPLAVVVSGTAYGAAGATLDIAVQPLRPLIVA